MINVKSVLLFLFLVNYSQSQLLVIHIQRIFNVYNDEINLFRNYIANNHTYTSVILQSLDYFNLSQIYVDPIRAKFRYICSNITRT